MSIQRVRLRMVLNTSLSSWNGFSQGRATEVSPGTLAPVCVPNSAKYSTIKLQNKSNWKDGKVPEYRGNLGSVLLL